MITIDFRFDCPCNFDKEKLSQFYKAGYFTHPVALIDLQSDYHSLIGGHKKNFQREAKHCKTAGYFVKEIHRQSYITEVVEINKSKEVRCGGVMKPDYKKTIDELGGQPAERIAPLKPDCEIHRGLFLGCFSNEPGYWKDGKLVAYIGLNMYGNFINYSMILGHGDYLRKGIMQFFHLEVLELLKLNGFSRYVIYYIYDTPQPTLVDWKRRAGFRPHKITFNK